MELAQNDWATYFHGITSEQQRLLVAIESVGPRAPVDERIDAMCDGVCTRHPLRTMCYEQRADIFEVAVGLHIAPGPLLRYFVAAPRRIFVRETEATRAIIVTDAGGGRTLVCVFCMEPWESRTGALTRPANRSHIRRRPAPLALQAQAVARSSHGLQHMLRPVMSGVHCGRRHER